MRSPIGIGRPILTALPGRLHGAASGGRGRGLAPVHHKAAADAVAGENAVSFIQGLPMSMKKTDLEKHLAKKLDGRMKSRAVPARFGQGSGAARAVAEAAARPAVARLIPVSFRLPADLVHGLRELALGHEGGISALAAEALARGLEALHPKR